MVVILLVLFLTFAHLQDLLCHYAICLPWPLLLGILVIEPVVPVAEYYTFMIGADLR